MRPRVFLDTNILLSGIFFKGNEAKVLDIVELELMTCEDVVDELFAVVRKKLKYLRDRNLEIALSETHRALSDIKIIPRNKYGNKIKFAEPLVSHKNDVPILSAVLYAKPDYFLTGDAHFMTDKVKDVVKVMNAKEFLNAIR